MIFFLCFSCHYKKGKNCEIRKMETLLTTIGIQDRDTAYGNYVLVKDFPRECMDSIVMVKLALNYIDSVSISKPIMNIKFYNSGKDFIPNETSQDIEKINKSCLVVIGFDEKKGIPNDFIFYNDKGEGVYWGDRWLPHGH
jgi:hypothetical protein